MMIMYDNTSHKIRARIGYKGYKGKEGDEENHEENIVII